MAQSQTVSTPGFIAAMVIIMMMSCCGEASSSISQRCRSRFRMCFRRYHRMLWSNIYPVITIDTFCNQNADLDRSNCFGDCLEEAQQSESYAIKLVFDYVCDPAKINEMKFVVEKSSCLRDVAVLQNYIEDDARDCEREFITRSISRQFHGVIDNYDPSADLGDVCPTINNMAACFFDKVRQRCGPLIMPLVKGMVQVGMDHFTSVMLPSCQLVIDDPTITAN